MVLNDQVKVLLDDIEGRLDIEIEDNYINQWRTFFRGDYHEDIFMPVRTSKGIARHEWQKISINDCIENFNSMLIDQLQTLSWQLSNDCALGVRSNYGTGIMPSLFGAELFMMPQEMNTLPTTRALGSVDEVKKVIEKGLPLLTSGLGSRVFEMGEMFVDTFAQYPKIREYVSIYHPDAQGPIDICELLFGSEMFYAFYDEPQVVHELLELVTQTYIAFMDKWFDTVGELGNHKWQDNFSQHWNTMHPGKVMLRNDSGMNLSPELFSEFSAQYDARIMAHFGGGTEHFCGRGDHFIEILSGIEGVLGINMSQPHLNDMEKIYRNTVDKGIFIVDFDNARAMDDKGRNGAFNNRLSAMSFD